MKLFFATTNKAKVSSVARVLGAHGITVEQAAIDLPELQAESAEEIARGKVAAAYAQLQAPVMVIDSAFAIDALGGFPGTNVKWATKQFGLQGYLDLLARYPDQSQRGCTFIDAVAYRDSFHADPRIVRRHERGVIAGAIRGVLRPTFKSPLAQIYVPDGCTQTLAEMSDEDLAAYRARPEMEAHLHALAGALTGSPASFE